MTIYDNPRSISFTDLFSRSLRFSLFQTHLPKQNRLLKPNFICSLHGMLGMKMCLNVQASKLIYEKKKLNKSRSSEPKSRWPWNLVYSIGYSSTSKFVEQIILGWTWPFLWQSTLCRLCFLMLPQGWKLIQYIVMYLQAYSKSAYPQHSGERYKTIGPLVSGAFCLTRSCTGIMDSVAENLVAELDIGLRQNHKKKDFSAIWPMIFLTRIRSHRVGPDRWLFVWSFL